VSQRLAEATGARQIPFEANGSGVTLKLEGKVLAPWLDELRRVCAQAAHESREIRLDLDAVTFVDAAGAELIRELIRQGITITCCSGFVAELVHMER
jgi:hypothetical protein